uniref:Uncharacterized protein n=1 Tax=Meloidogyne enterolobii TaxID=390850 RepID=A0A6V7W2X3_MELEN|nr:unnamed protein product [Meloidogyne enterolobii]
MNLNNNLSTSLSTYLQNGDICNYLDLTRINKIDNLVNKLSLLDSLNNKTIFDFLFINIKHQLIVAECTYKSSLNLISSPSLNIGIWTTKLPFIVVPAIFAIISMLLNISLIFVSFKKLKVKEILFK